MSDDWLTMEGTSSFTYQGESPEESCSGSGSFTGVRTVAEEQEEEGGPEDSAILNFPDLNGDWPIYLGWVSHDHAAVVEVDRENNLIVTGITDSDDFSWLNGDELREQEGLWQPVCLEV